MVTKAPQNPMKPLPNLVAQIRGLLSSWPPKPGARTGELHFGELEVIGFRFWGEVMSLEEPFNLLRGPDRSD